jgi:hypothetical protein
MAACEILEPDQLNIPKQWSMMALIFANGDFSLVRDFLLSLKNFRIPSSAGPKIDSKHRGVVQAIIGLLTCKEDDDNSDLSKMLRDISDKLSLKM